MTTILHEIRPGAYYDSVVLMQLQRALLALDGILDTGVVMATQANLELLEDTGLTIEGVAARAEDLLIVVKAKSKPSAEAALGKIDELLTRRRSAASSAYRPRSLSAAANQLPQAMWVLVSIPGRYAAQVARQALELDKHVFLYSDNVSLDDEIALKTFARDKGLLVMGPDCGTAIVNGVGFGFANRVRRGRIGLVGASGTGVQAITAAVHNLGQGISHELGTGGRDLMREVDAICARQALSLLARDTETEVIVLVSKPPDPDVAASLLSAARQTGKATVINFIGYAAPAHHFGNLHFSQTLQDAAEQAVQLLGVRQPTTTSEPAPSAHDGRRYVRGLFSGGTLAIETVRGLGAFLSPIYTNLSGTGAATLADPLVSEAHTILDLGDDIFTVGRLHPMLDNDLRLRRLKQEASDPQVALILLDVVLGEGAHPDPAGEFAPVIRQVREEFDVGVAVLLIGTDEDPQDLAYQRSSLEAAGAMVFNDTLSLVLHATQYVDENAGDRSPEVSLEALNAPVAALNIGLESFFDSLKQQGAEVVQVDWRPPASGDERLMNILRKMKASGTTQDSNR
jgi:FdrA protein